MALTTAYYYTPNGRSIQRPLAGTQLETAAAAAGGIRPDHVVYPAAQSRLRVVLDASGSFTTFATEYVRKRTSVTESFQVTAALMDEFQAWAAERNIRPGVSQWFADASWIRLRLQQEILNLAVGVHKGDEIELRNDPQVLKALDVLGVR